jgi:hypothetical protein
MAGKWEDVRDSIVGAVESRAKQFLDDNKTARDFLRERAERLAKLTVLYAEAKDSVAREALSRDFVVVKQAMENELAALALQGSSAAKSLFGHLLSVAFDTLIKVLPSLVTAL